VSHSNTTQDDQYQSYELNVSHCVDESAICAEVALLAQSDLSIKITLVGNIDIDIIPDTKNITNCCRESFFALELVDHTSLLESVFVREMAQENTVRGVVVKRLLELSKATTNAAQLRIYELTLRELLARFEVMQGGDYS